MSIWGRRDSEPPPGDAHESQSPVQAQAPGEPEPGSQAEPQAQAEPEDQAEEPAPAFWRAQGETPASSGRSPADAPPLADTAPTADAPPPAHGNVPDGAPAPSGGPAAPAPDDMVVLDGATAVKEPALTGTAVDDAGMGGMEPASAVSEAGPEPVVPGPAPPEAGAPAAADAPAADAPASLAGISAQRWSEIMTTFVDDPRGSVKLAADAVAEAVDEFVASVRARQRALESSWHGTETDTEQLRTALRDYRTFWHQVQQLDPAGKTGA